jgi:hypothetical protein
MSNTKDSIKKYKKRVDAKLGIAEGSIMSGGLISPSIGTTAAYMQGDIDRDVEKLKETSNPENNMVSVGLSPNIPVPEEQPVMPIPDASLQATQLRRRRARQSRTGRNSTILTGGRLGG